MDIELAGEPGSVIDQPQIMLEFCKAMADESRLKIVGLLSTTEHSVQDLAGLLNLKEPTVSHHLAVLKELDLVTLRAAGNVHWYRLRSDVLRKISRAVFSTENIARIAVSAEADGWHRKVLDTFVHDQRLTEIPVSRKKRWVILKWLVQDFEPGANYSEAEVNNILKQHHDDCATLRRELIGYRMLARAAGIYRRNPDSEWLRADK
jgi:hypothetical protein